MATHSFGKHHTRRVSELSPTHSSVPPFLRAVAPINLDRGPWLSAPPSGKRGAPPALDSRSPPGWASRTETVPGRYGYRTFLGHARAAGARARHPVDPTRL